MTATRRRRIVLEGSAHAEHRWPALVAILLVIVADLLLPSAFGAITQWVVPGIAGVLAIALLAINPHRMTVETRASRVASIALAVILLLLNQAEVVATVAELVDGSAAAPLVLLRALRVWLTDVVVFGLLFWEIDRRGPVARRLPDDDAAPDFRFPQEDSGDRTAWRPGFVDYAYFSLSNMMAFSPTDVMPLTARAKLLMALQAFTGFVLLALVISRAVNILG